MPHFTHDDVRLYYESFGEGEPLVLIMGLGGVIQAWGMQIPAFAQRYRVIAMDNRGAGRSDKPAGPYRIVDMAEDVRALLDELGLDSAHILGASMGGLIAQEFYHRHPERVRSLILVCTGTGANDPSYVAPEPEVMEALAMDRGSEDPKRVMQAWVDTFYHPDYVARIPQLTDKLLEFERAMPQPPHAFEAQLQACLTHEPNSPRLGRIEVPTLVVHGEHDRVWPLANAEYLARNIPDAALRVIPDSAHMLIVEQPKAFNAAVLAFLDEATRGAALSEN